MKIENENENYKEELKEPEEEVEYLDRKRKLKEILKRCKYVEKPNKNKSRNVDNSNKLIKEELLFERLVKEKEFNQNNLLSCKVISNESTNSHDKRKRRPKRSYVGPEYYSHLPSGVPDVLKENLIVMFIGLNPGIATVKAGHAFAGPTNLFWKLLHSSRIVCTETRLRPEDDVKLTKWDVGITNLVSRPTASSNELSKEEMIESVPILEKKIITFYPLSVCIVGKGIYEAIYKYKTGKSLSKPFKWGWQPQRVGKSENYEGALVYVVPSTSGREASYSREMKEHYWNILGEWVELKRKERQNLDNTLK
ncbi:hypothetical protein T552_01045 [Pneumocystis carinii B80]|uniref:Uracil-DNA glycosylase-like domain-containing protein n=1 Tax=Pneumocystis carinii (strain B80) TaxID=1408658 RepID=A0A0W4ZNA6_PNEC8|nr:hypothetical protein T552_01045 [Pneumocystis carinii B80]KTW29841.1 hypothetical protein T552_01045 [Pneumocystis carinii B80]